MDVWTFLLLSLTPGVEPRYAVLLASATGWGAIPAFLLGSLLSVLLAGALVLFMEILDALLPRIPLVGTLWRRYRERVVPKVRPYVERWGVLGLTLFVAVPLPGTGIWTGALAAYILGMGRGKAFLALSLGGIISCLLLAFLPGAFGVQP